MMPQSRRTFVERVDFITSFGHGDGGDHRRRLGLRTQGPTLVITDLCTDAARSGDAGTDRRLAEPGVTREQVIANTGWTPRFAERVEETPPPSAHELEVLRGLQDRTAEAHGPGPA